jgi:hypothetical protein
MLDGAVRFDPAEDADSRDRSRSAAAMAELFAPLDRLLGCGGDPRLRLNQATAANEYGCQPFPCPDTLSFASSTATSISVRAYERAGHARGALMRSAIDVGIDAAFDARVESMRGELKNHLGLPNADIVFSPSGTDSQLHALFLTRALLGPALTTIIVAADQTGSGTAYTSRGCHFSAATANGSPVQKSEPVAGLAHSVTSVALGLLDDNGDCRPQADTDARVLAAIETSIANGAGVLLQVMDSSKLGWRAPSDRCLDEIAARWPDRVQVVVDACQMRLGRPRLKQYLDRGYLVLITGSKFFTGPPFSGALLVPAHRAATIDAINEVAPGMLEYSSRGDWPMQWQGLRSRFPIRANFGQWLRWEAALEEIRAYHGVPDELRRMALTVFGEGVERIIASSPSLRLLPPQQRLADDSLDEELAQRTIFPFVLTHRGRALPLEDCRKIYRALARDARESVSVEVHGRDAEIAAQLCLIGQPVALSQRGPHPVAALRICAGARLVTETWSSDANSAYRNLQCELGHVGTIVAKIEWLLEHIDDLNSTEVSRGA